jgi:hypothetical protein
MRRDTKVALPKAFGAGKLASKLRVSPTEEDTPK